MVSEMRETYEEIIAIELRRKSERQLKKWRTLRDSSVEVFVEVLGGDRPIASLTRADAMALRSHWEARILADEVEIDTGNKNIGRVAGMVRVINETKTLGLPGIFERMSIRGGTQKQRVAYAPPFVQTEFMADGVFEELNAEARRIIYLVAETGLRLAEACNLSRTTIKLDAEVPHVQVRADGREMKTDHSRRDVPLVGVALTAMKVQPDGFPRYRDKADSLSALVNKVLDARGLRPEPGQSLYSLRHTFEDRLTAVEAPEKVVAALMGHKWHRPRYGLGPSLEQKRDWLNRIAFRPPTSV
jgi:integrase